MALRAGLLRWRHGLHLAAGLAAGTATYALCESDVRGPSFDPEALERGAKALREINASPNAKKVTYLPRLDRATSICGLLHVPQHSTACDMEFHSWENVTGLIESVMCFLDGMCLHTYTPACPSRLSSHRRPCIRALCCLCAGHRAYAAAGSFATD